MSTKQTPTAHDLGTIQQPATQNAPLTFDPLNTNPTPEMFEDKWQANDE